MGTIDGSASTDIEVPVEAVYAVAADIEGSPRWQPEIKLAECVERDAEGDQVLVRMETDAKVRRLGSTIRFSYERPDQIGWVQEDGDLKSIQGGWEFEDLGSGKTRVTYSLEVDLGRVLGMLIRGPMVGALRGQMIDSMPEKLKRFMEDGSADR
jgi:ribosome-associated toxin RatA of RatAB toxin-antitoxin module